MFVESVNWSEIIIVAVVSLISLIILAFVTYNSYKKEDGEFKFGVVAILFVLLLGIAYTLVAIEYTIESNPMDYTLKEPLEINIDIGYKSKIDAKEDSGGLKIIPSKNKDKITEKISFAKGDVVKIKTIEEYDIVSKRKNEIGEMLVFL